VTPMGAALFTKLLAGAADLLLVVCWAAALLISSSDALER
jgi:hypothetical protein